MTRFDNDTIDFSKLERDLDAAVEADARYSRENDAKFRAISQKVGSYDEFRDIVLASHLKPLEKGDKINHNNTFQQPWNILASAKSSTQQNESVPLQNEVTIPKTGHEFARYWRKIGETSEMRYKYLEKIGTTKLMDLFKTEIAFGLLGEIIVAVEDYNEADYAFVFDLLKTLAESGRFQLSVQFLSTIENTKLELLLEKIKSNCPDVDETAVLNLSDKYCLNKR